MRILYLAHRVPYPPSKGDKIRALHELRALSARGHSIDLFAFADDPADLHHEAELRRFCASVVLLPLRAAPALIRALRALPSSTPLTVAYFDSHSMHAAVRRAIERARPDVVIVFSSSMAQYVPRELRARTVVDLIDVDSEKWRDYSKRASFPAKAVYALEARRLRSYEYSLTRDFPQILLTTSREIDLLAGSASHGMHALMNGVDTEYFQPGSRNDHSPPEIVFTGVMDYYPNVDAMHWFVREVWPALAHVTGIRLTIVGSRPSAAVRALDRIPGITVTGTVTDVRPYLQRAAVAVVPLRVARGIQNKVLEAMAAGIPVVATPDSVRAFGDPEFPVRVAAEPRQFADAILSLLANVSERAALSKAARAYVERHHRWQPTLDRFCHIVESTATGTT